MCDMYIINGVHGPGMCCVFFIYILIFLTSSSDSYVLNEHGVSLTHIPSQASEELISFTAIFCVPKMNSSGSDLIKMYLQLTSFLHTEMAQVIVEILPHKRQELNYQAHSLPVLELLELRCQF